MTCWISTDWMTATDSKESCGVRLRVPLDLFRHEVAQQSPPGDVGVSHPPWIHSKRRHFHCQHKQLLNSILSITALTVVITYSSVVYIISLQCRFHNIFFVFSLVNDLEWLSITQYSFIYKGGPYLIARWMVNYSKKGFT